MPIEKWEYRTEFVYANIEGENAKQYIAEKYPNWKNPPKYTPETMEPYLNRLGEDGWELVHMQPVGGVGSNGDVRYVHGGNVSVNDWSNVYFCVFKRRTR